MPTEEQILDRLRTIIDPDLKKDIVSLNMIRDLKIADGEISLRFVLTTPACPFRDALTDSIRSALRTLDGVAHIHITPDASVPKLPGIFNRAAIAGVRNIIAVVSGKGGVGKSSVSVNIASALAEAGAKVGLLDADIYGPSIPVMLGMQQETMPGGDNGDEKMKPLERHGLKIVSFGFVAKKDTAVIWRGPLASKALRQFLTQIDWGELDYLVVDMPPGTGDVHLTLLQAVPLSGGVIVTTPQEVALADATRALAMFRTLHSPVLGVMENMSGSIFGQGGGERMADTESIPFLGRIPLDGAIREAADAGAPLLAARPNHEISKLFRQLAGRLAQEVSKNALS